jgi:hypothetical protein
MPSLAEQGAAALMLKGMEFKESSHLCAIAATKRKSHPSQRWYALHTLRAGLWTSTLQTSNI